MVRRALRDVGCAEFNAVEDGFAVDAGGDAAPFLVACTIGERAAAEREMQRYRLALTAAGMPCERHPENANVLLVWATA
jgi:hypothetical protein